MDELIQLGWPMAGAQERKRKERGLPSAASMSTEELRGYVLGRPRWEK